MFNYHLSERGRLGDAGWYIFASPPVRVDGGDGTLEMGVECETSGEMKDAFNYNSSELCREAS